MKKCPKNPATLTLKPEEFLAGIARITSFEMLGIPNYTQTQWQTLPPLTKIAESLRIRDRGKTTLDTRVSDDHDWRNDLGWDVHDCFGSSAKFKELEKKGYTLREYLEQVCMAELGDKGLEEYIRRTRILTYREPYFTNNLEPNLRDVWEGKRPLSSAYGPKLVAIVEDFKKKTGWKKLPRIEATQWEKDRALYPLRIFLHRKGLILSR